MGHFTGAPISQTQQPAASIERGPPDTKTSTDSLCHCADYHNLRFGVQMLLYHFDTLL